MKTTARIIIIFLCTALLYSTAMYGYVWMQMRPIKPLVPPSALASYAKRPPVHMIHAVNSIRRAQAKDARYSGMEIDINRLDNRLVAAHDAGQKPAEIPEIFAALTHPETKTFWIDVKTELTQNDIDQLLAWTKQYHIHPRHLFFEVKGGKTADLLKANGLPILLQIPSDFAKDNHDPVTRARLNIQLENLIRRYQPFALAGSLGKYPYLKTYFPQYARAIYSSTTKRPSLKKYFLTRAIMTDPQVQIWMQDEYTLLPF